MNATGCWTGAAMVMLCAGSAFAQAPGVIVVDGFSPRKVSADGRVVAGIVGQTNQIGLWTEQGGIQPLGFDGNVGDLNANGSVLCGTSFSDTGVRGAFRWTPGGGREFLSNPGDSYFAQEAYALTAEGNNIFGTTAAFSLYRWNTANGAAELSPPSSIVGACNADGRVIGGLVLDGGDRATLWIDEAPLRLFPATVGFGSAVISLSDDGSVAIGRGPTQALANFIWDASNGARGVPGFNPFGLRALSGDGQVVLGNTGSAPGIWDAQAGTRSLATVLAAVGVDLTGISLGQAVDMSADAAVVVGTIRNSDPARMYVARIRAGTPPCRANFDGSADGVQVADIFAFLSAWFGSQPSADIDGQPGIAVGDIFAFLSLWFAGC